MIESVHKKLQVHGWAACNADRVWCSVPQGEDLLQLLDGGCTQGLYSSASAALAAFMTRQGRGSGILCCCEWQWHHNRPEINTATVVVTIYYNIV